ncbi:hypothetical protein K2X05_00030 [bacterium]|nr:hypothetical protein [bacterium]
MRHTLIYITLFFCLSTQAQLASFTSQEIQAHTRLKLEIAKMAAECLDWHYNDHIDFFEKYGISKYYGNRRKDYATRDGLMKALQHYGKPTNLVQYLEPISCIGLSMKCLKTGFESVGMAETWDKIYAELAIDNNFFGTDLQRNLINLGWKSYYWNPQPENNELWDLEDQKINPVKDGKKWNPVWGGHQARYNQVMNKGIYYNIPIHDRQSLVGFNDQQPGFFKSIPFFVGIAHAGYHVFPGRYGDVIEAHSMRDLNSRDNLEFSQFNPLATGGGPRWTKSEKYRSGVIVVPN